MELIASLGLAVVVLVVFDLAAFRYGVDSRDGIGDDRRHARSGWN